MYDTEFVARIHKLPSATLSEVLDRRVSHAEVKLQYANNKEFETIAKRLKVMSDLRVSVYYKALINGFIVSHQPPAWTFDRVNLPHYCILTV